MHALRIAKYLAAALVVCSAAQSRAADEMVFAVARLPLSLPVYVAEAKGYFADEKLVVRLVDCEFGRLCLDRLLGGAAHLATASDSPIVLASLRRAKFSVLATIATTRNDTKIVARRDSGISSAAGLSGKRLGTFTGTSAQYFLDLMLLSAGVDPQEVTVVPIQPSEVAQALTSHSVDAVAIFEPFAFIAVQALGSEAQVFSNRRLHVETWNVVIAPALVQMRERDLEALCRALDRAIEFIAREPSQARTILRKRLGLDDAALAWMLPDIHYAIELRQSLVTGLEGQARWALRSGHAAGSPPNYLGYIHAGPLSRTRPGAASIVQ